MQQKIVRCKRVLWYTDPEKKQWWLSVVFKAVVSKKLVILLQGLLLVGVLLHFYDVMED